MSARQSKASSAKSTPRTSAKSGHSATKAGKGKAKLSLEDEELEGDVDVEDDGGEPEDEELILEAGEGDGKSTLKEDPVLDRRIIEGMLKDRKALLEDLAKEGMTQAVVLRRAAELGLSEALLRQVKGVAADLAGERPGRRAAPSTLGARTCLSCDRVFLSTGPGNRLCMRCRGGDAGLAQF